MMKCLILKIIFNLIRKNNIKNNLIKFFKKMKIKLILKIMILKVKILIMMQINRKLINKCKISKN